MLTLWIVSSCTRISLITAMKLSELKFQKAKLMYHMFANKIWMRYNQSESLQTTALGFFQGVHPRATHRNEFVFHLDDAIHSEMTKAEQNKIKEFIPANKKRAHDGEAQHPVTVAHIIGFGNGAGRIKTHTFEIRVPLEIHLEIKEILTRLDSKELIPDDRFIPYDLVQTVGTQVYKKMLQMQNFLEDFCMVPVFSITPHALEHIINPNKVQLGGSQLYAYANRHQAH
jgi:hypothetical protein